MNIYKYTLIALAWAFSLAVNAQTIVYVDAAATGFNNGTSWANAFKELQPAIDAAALTTPAQVWVKKGTYYPTATTDRDISFIMKNDVEIYGGFKGIETVLTDRDWTTHETILSGDIGTQGVDTDNSYNVIDNSYLVASPLLNTSIIDGVIIEKGYYDGIFTNAGGAGMRNINASPIIRNCNFRNNYTSIGAGGALNNIGESHPFISGCKFISNTSGNWGGAIGYRTQSLSHNVLSTITNCLFYDNHSNSVGGAIYVIGYYVNIINNTIANNTSAQTGVGIFFGSGSGITVATYTNNIIWGNTTTSTATVDIQLRLGTPNRPIVSRSIVEDGYPGSVIFNTDPLFYDAPNGDFSIKNCNSPAINVGVNASLPSGIANDLAQSARIFDTTIDLGAYEYQYLPMSFSAIELGHVSCNGNTDGQISVNVGGGASPFTYNVDGGSFGTNPILTGLAAGNHIVIAKDAFGCEISTTENITEPAALTIAVTSTNLTCNLNNDGSASVIISGGSTPYKLYLDGNFIENLTGNTYLQDEHDAGTYTYGIVDANGCIIAANPITITEPPVLTASLAKNNDVTCNGANDGSVILTATGGTAPYTYSLDGINFQSSNTFANLAPAAYTVEVRDANYVALASGCSAISGSVTIIEPTALSTSVAKVDLVCAGSQLGEIAVTASGGTAPLAYSIDGTTFQSSATFSALSAGAYTLTTKDGNGCTVTDNTTLTEPTALSSTSTSANISCNGQSDGSIITTASGGTAPYTYSIDGTNFSSSGSFMGLIAGNYTVTFKDATNCSSTESIMLSEPSTLAVTNAAQNISCNSLADGSVTATASGGTSPYEYSIDGTNFSSTAEFLSLASGSYTISVKDANNCSVSKDFEVTEPEILSTSLTATNLTCNADQTGKIIIAGTGGTAPLTYSIDGTTFQSGATFGSLAAGSYTITTKDASGCTATDNITLTEPVVLSATTVIENITCNGLTNGAVQITATGGTTPYEYSIDGTNFSSTNSFANLATGNFTLTIRDANGCKFADNITITTPDELVVTAQTNAILCNGDANGSITLTGSGGTSPYEYSIDGTNFQTENEFASLTAGDFTLTMLDSKGCTTSINVTIAQPDELTLAASFDGASIALTATGGTTPYNYSVDGSTFQTSSTFVLGNGQYTFTVKDDNDCEATTSQSLVITALNKLPNLEQVSIYPNPATSELYLQGLAAGDEIRLFDQSGRKVYSKKVDNLTSQISVSSLENGVYTILIINKNGGVSRFKLMKK